jgi:hypothetical protein
LLFRLLRFREGAPWIFGTGIHFPGVWVPFLGHLSSTSHIIQRVKKRLCVCSVKHSCPYMIWKSHVNMFRLTWIQSKSIDPQFQLIWFLQMITKNIILIQIDWYATAAHLAGHHVPMHWLLHFCDWVPQNLHFAWQIWYWRLLGQNNTKFSYNEPSTDWHAPSVREGQIDYPISRTWNQKLIQDLNHMASPTQGTWPTRNKCNLECNISAASDGWKKNAYLFGKDHFLSATLQRCSCRRFCQVHSSASVASTYIC